MSDMRDKQFILDILAPVSLGIITFMYVCGYFKGLTVLIST